MLKYLKAALSLISLLVVLFATGCGAGSQKGNAVVDLKGRTVKIFSQTQIDPRKNEGYKTSPTYDKAVAFWNSLESNYNCKIECISYNSFERFQEGYITAFAAGTVIADVITGDATLAYPTWMVSGMLAPLDGLYDYKDEKGDSVWDPRHAQNFIYNGKCYGIWPKGQSMPSFIFMFNKRIFSEYEQLKKYDLYKLVKNKEWTWDKFREVARAATIDENGDGKPDIMGVATMGQPGSYLNNALIPSNGCLFVRKENGRVIFDLDNPKALAAMELTYKMAWEDQCLGVKGVFDSWEGGYNEFAAGRVAILVAGLGNVPEFKEKMKNDKYGILPVPIGPAMNDYVSDVALFNFWGAVPNAPEPEKTAKLITALVSPPDFGISFREAHEGNYFDEESLDILEMLCENPTFSSYYGYRTMIEQILWSDYGLLSKTPPATFVAEKKNIVQSGIDKAWTPLTKEQLATTAANN